MWHSHINSNAYIDVLFFFNFDLFFFGAISKDRKIYLHKLLKEKVEYFFRISKFPLVFDAVIQNLLGHQSLM